MKALIFLPVATLAVTIGEGERELNGTVWTDEYRRQCLGCMCQVATGCNRRRGCETDVTPDGVSFDLCGPYQLTEYYWYRAESPGEEKLGFKGCAQNKTCADRTIIEFNRRHVRDCNRDGKYDCTDWALIFQDGGTEICDKPLVGRLRGFWSDVTTCMGQKTVSHPLNGNRGPTTVNGTTLQRCLGCIREAVTTCSSARRCTDRACGEYQISKKFWEDAGSPHKSERENFAGCARHKICSENTIIITANRYGKDCNGDGEFDCLDVGLMHQGGIHRCEESSLKLTRFWRKYTKCLG